MTLIVVFAAIVTTAVITVFIVGAVLDHEDLKFTGAALIFLWVMACIIFQCGACWQKDDTVAKYHLTKKQ